MFYECVKLDSPTCEFEICAFYGGEKTSEYPSKSIPSSCHLADGERGVLSVPVESYERLRHETRRRDDTSNEEVPVTSRVMSSLEISGML
ncbi:hypothetical protein HYALB_00004968 [Hymenoscyphus albidus]|uniref:Uncharacterized protein n=1 Tax=Hymenoscyphus albidus TaxID=595503 RepID=A0A9N9Q9Y9_9HELO|nr:hypothetical protein HYALB_00004968 [Hymenoscyphus albidus]